MHSMLKVVSLLSRAIGTPVGLAVHKAVSAGDLSALGAYGSLDPNAYARPESYLKDAQVLALFRKLEGLDLGIDLHQKAVETFKICEDQCASSNGRLAQYLNWFERGFCSSSYIPSGVARDERMYLFIKSVRKKLADVLGPLPRDLVPRLSKGSTFYDKGESITIPHKMESLPSVTAECWSIVRDLFRSTAWDRCSDAPPEIVLGNRFTSVPKDSTKNRGICIEPSLNVAYQLAVGSHIKRRLLESCDIRIDHHARGTAQELHKQLAQKASESGLLATIDLSNASDNVSIALVKLLLPKGWFNLLNGLRSPYTFIEGVWNKNQKFSSMGCGFTFELETLIFWALLQECDPDVRVFGDDIILRSLSGEDAVAVLSFFGFTANASKTFIDPLSPFRESCGGDYFGGVAVRPIFLKVIPSTPLEWMELANRIHEISCLLRGNIHTTLAQKARTICINQIPSGFRVFGPVGTEGVIHDEDCLKWRIRMHMCHQDTVHPRRPQLFAGYFELKVLKTLSRRVKLDKFSPHVVLASALLQTPSEGPVPRNGIAGYRIGWAPTVM